MAQDNESDKSTLEKLLFGDGRSEREDRVREYITHRLKEGAHLREVLQEEYVRRNCTRAELDEIVMDPRVVQQDREGLAQYFSSEELSIKHPPSAAEGKPEGGQGGESFPPPPGTIPSR